MGEEGFFCRDTKNVAFSGWFLPMADAIFPTEHKSKSYLYVREDHTPRGQGSHGDAVNDRYTLTCCVMRLSTQHNE